MFFASINELDVEFVNDGESEEYLERLNDKGYRIIDFSHNEFRF